MFWCTAICRLGGRVFARGFQLGTVILWIAVFASFAAHGDNLDRTDDGLELEMVADLMHDIAAANREAYSQVVVNRLMIQEKIINSDEHYAEKKALLLPAHFFRLAAELAATKNSRAVYSLQSFWAIRRQNLPDTEMEKIGLAKVLGGTRAFYGTEGPEGAKHFIAAYPDAATNQACVTCHNNHPESRRQDFALGEVMGGLVVRIPLGRDGQAGGKDKGGTGTVKMSYQEVAGLVNAITAANRETYDSLVSARLTEKEHVIDTDEKYLEKKCLPLAVQLFNIGALLANSKTRTASYSLRSGWPINKGSLPSSKVEKAGLAAAAAGKDSFYGIETAGTRRTFVAVYPDVAHSQDCVTCHNRHPNSPRRDFKLGSVMGGVVVRIPMRN